MTISTQIIAVLDDLCRRFGLAIDWTQENIMPYLQELAGEYINWEIATSKAYMILGGVLLAIGVILFVCDLCNGWDGIGCMFGVCIFVTGLIIIGRQTLDILTCVHFPEKQIVEYISELMRSKT